MKEAQAKHRPGEPGNVYPVRAGLRVSGQRASLV